MSCTPCAMCDRRCARVVTPEGLVCRECAAKLANGLRDEGGDR